MRQREHDARLVGFRQGAQHIGLVRIRYHEETGEVVLVVLDMILQHLQSIEPRSLRMTDGSPALVSALGNHLCRTSRILGLHILQRGMLSQELTALHQGHRMGMDLRDGVPIVIRQTTDTM